MSSTRHIAIYWSPGRSLAGALEAMTRLEPDARICAVVPQDYAPNDTERRLAHEIIQSDRTRYSMREPRPLLRWIARLRRERFDELAVLFDSPRLMLLAASAHPRAIRYLRPNGTLGRLPASMPGALATLVGRRLRGRCAYAILWVLVRVCRASDNNPARPLSSRHDDR